MFEEEAGGPCVCRGDRKAGDEVRDKRQLSKEL